MFNPFHRLPVPLMKRCALLLFLIGLTAACQPRQTQQVATEPAVADTVVVDDDTLESNANKSGIDSSIVAVATLPNPETVGTGASPTDFLIIPGQQAGPITATATEASLIQSVGSQNVTHESIDLGEGDSEPGTTLFKGTANEVHILWKDKKRFANPDAVLIRPTGDATKNGDVVPSWQVANGLKIGSTLREVERINGRPFTLYGFGRDMGGSLSNARGGTLQGANGKAYLGLTFGPGKVEPTQKKLLDRVAGNREFMSSLPAMQQLNPKVEVIRISFR